MYKSEPCLPSHSKIYRRAMCTWWRREQYMSVHPPDLNFSGQMSGLQPAPYPIGFWNPWEFNMGMNNMDTDVFPCVDSGTNSCKSSKKNDKTSIPRMIKIPESGSRPQCQTSSRVIPPLVHPTYYAQQSKLSQRNMPPRFQPSNFKQQGPLLQRQIPPPIQPSLFKQQDQLCPRYITPLVQQSHYKQKGQLNPRYNLSPPVQPSHYEQEGQLRPRIIPPPVQPPFQKPFKNQSANSTYTSKNQVCSLCFQNEERKEWYSNHQLKDQNGKVTCPVLRRYVCVLCKATGDYAHTKAYCPLNKKQNKKPLAVKLKETSHDSCGRIRKPFQ